MMHIVKKMVLWYDYCVWKVMHMKCWNDLFQQEIEKPYYQELMAFLDEEYKTKTIFLHVRICLPVLMFAHMKR